MIYSMYIDGEWYEGENNYRDVISPASGKVLGQIPLGTKEDVDRAVQAAHRQTKVMEQMTVFERAELLNQIADITEKNAESLAKLLSEEHGKPYATEATGEIESTVTGFREAAEQIKWMNSEIIPTRDRKKRAFAYRKPRGIYGVITPWNFPLGCAASYYLAPGLAVGNTIVWVPAPSTSAVASEFMKCVEETDLPKGALNLVIGDGPVVGDALVTHKQIAAIGFTGSTPTGEIIASRAGAKPCLLEMGGNGPSIVLEDADVETTATALINGSFTNAGQVCTATGRVLVHDAIADELVKALIEKTKNVKLGDPFDSETTMGPVHTQNVADTVVSQVEDAVKKGATVITGGNVEQNRPTSLYVEPTIVDNVPKEAKLNTDETFGPVIPLIRFKDEAEIPELIETSPFRLSSAVFSKDTEKAIRLAEGLKFGFVHINEAGNYWETQIPAGGTSGSASGIGRSGGKSSIEEMSEVCTVVLTLSGGPDHE